MKYSSAYWCIFFLVFSLVQASKSSSIFSSILSALFGLQFLHLLFFYILFSIANIMSVTCFASIRSCRPSHLGTCMGARDFGHSYLLVEHLAERVGDAFWRTAFYDGSVGQAMAQHLGQAAWAR